MYSHSLLHAFSLLKIFCLVWTKELPGNGVHKHDTHSQTVNALPVPFSPACNQTSHRLWKGSQQAEENLCSIQLCWTFMCILPSTSVGLCREKFGSCAACVKIIAICPHRLHCFQVEHQAATLWCVVQLLRERLLISLIVYTKKRGGCIIFNLNRSTNT